MQEQPVGTKMNSLDIYHTAKQIYETVKESSSDIAVFNFSGEILTIPAIGRKFDLMYKDFKKEFIAVYNKHCTIDMIKGDLV